MPERDRLQPLPTKDMEAWRKPPATVSAGALQMHLGIVYSVFSAENWIIAIFI
jgi:hypothetical protein